ncbi:MAG: 3-phosphoserine/phosphohydroxythreonine transaminase [Planctomycetota bacterium]|nr:3-phosphoserine/phosphohydroxythreonine transaminase [Planctomycetota bacterium]
MRTNTAVDRVFNFSAGPAVLPVPVIEEAQRDLLSLPGCGASILEISHRSKPFIAILEDAEQRLRDLLAIPRSYRVLFLQGGSRLQFSMVPMNLLRGSGKAAEFVLTGSWSNYAIKEAKREGQTRVLWDGRDTNYDRLPKLDELPYGDSAYVHLTSNETIQGVQFASDPKRSESVFVADMSSDFMHRPVDVSRYGLIYACAQKNAGPAGVTVVIVREDLLERSADSLPGYMNYQAHHEANSLYNTPPTFGIYVVGLVCKWLQEEVGGLANMYQRNRDKARLLYDVLDESPDFYQGHARASDRSLMNATFRLPSDELTAAFVCEAAAHQLESLEGHRSVGGIRASIYNAMPVEGVEALRDLMVDFRNRHAS